MHFPTIFALALVVTQIATTASANVTNADLSRDPVAQTRQIKQIILEEFAGEPTSVINTITRICMCESGGRNKAGKPTGTIVHIEADGEVRKGDIDSRDTGACQINPAMHSKDWKREHGFSRRVARTVRGNIRYARALIQDKRDRNTSHRLGIWEDWAPSQSCWK